MSDLASLVIRQPFGNEVDRLAAIGANLFIETWGHLYSEEDLRAYLDRVHSPSGVQEDLAQGYHFWIAEIDQEWIGYAKWGKVTVPIEGDRSQACELKQLYVFKGYHGLGVAHAFMRQFASWADENRFQMAYISCWSENYRALAFYKKYGFEKTGEYQFMVGKQADREFILGCPLPLRLTQPASECQP